jgi:hypothetical protein
MAEKSPIFLRSISVGNVIQIGVMIIGLTVGWITMDMRSQGNTQALQALGTDITSIQDDIDGFDARMRVVETEQARADERFGSILSLLSRIDARLERIEGDR